MSITKASFQRLTARLFISPPPTTLNESTAVLKKLQSFGTVVSFTKTTANLTHPTSPASPPEPQEVNIVFSSPETIQKVHEASPFTVRVNHDLPDPEVEDPYNVRNLQSRKQPRPHTMTCRLDPLYRELPPEHNWLSEGFSPRLKTRLYQSLLDLNPPPGILAGLGVFRTDTENFGSTAGIVKTPPDLMEMYHSPSLPSEPTKSAGTSSPAAPAPVHPEESTRRSSSD